MERRKIRDFSMRRRVRERAIGARLWRPPLADAQLLQQGAMPTGVEERLRGAALQVGRDWKGSPYYDAAEQGIETQWRELIWPFLTEVQEDGVDFSLTVDLAAGHGRNSA